MVLNSIFSRILLWVFLLFDKLSLNTSSASSSLPSSSESFRRAVVSDERSFTPDLLDQACRVLDRIAAPIDLCNKFAEAVRLIKVCI